MSCQEQVTAKFNKDFGACYDYKVQATIPGYSFLHDMSRALIAANVHEEANILIAGPGIGKELINFGSMFPGWTFTAFDPSPDMLALTKNAITEQNIDDRVTLIQGTLDSVPDTERFDAAVSILVMHFIPDDGAKAGFLGALAARLAPEAPLILADMHGRRGEGRVENLYDSWKTYLGHIEYDAGTIDEELKMLHFVSEERIESLLAEAGFVNVSRFYQAFLCGGWFARKRGER